MSAVYALPFALNTARIPKPGTAPLIMKRGRTIGLWSDPGTWGGRLPRPGETVVIPPGGRVLLDTSPPPLAGLQVDGLLWFDDGDLTLTMEWLMVRGEFRIGAPGRPAQGQVKLQLAANARGRGGGAARFAAVMDGGLLALFGEWRLGRTKLAASCAAGDTQIVVTHLTEWRPGDLIVVGLTGSPAHLAEQRRIMAVDGPVLTLDAPLANAHWGGLQHWQGITTDWRTEVGLLTRNVSLRGAEGPAERAGGYLLAMPGGRLHLEGVEITGLGHSEHLPIRLDPASGPEALTLTDCSLHHSRRPVSMLFQGQPQWLRQNVVYDSA